MNKESLREKLADLEHEQWAHWTIYMLDNLTKKNLKRWGEQVATSYSELSEKEKDSDREWADKVLKVFKEKIQNVQRRIKDFVKHNPFYPPQLSVKSFKEIDKIFLEEIGKELLK